MIKKIISVCYVPNLERGEKSYDIWRILAEEKNITPPPPPGELTCMCK